MGQTNRVRLALLLLAAAAMPIVPGLEGPVVAQAMSAAVGKPLQAARSAAGAGNYAAANSAIAQARAAAKTSQERTAVAQMAAFVHTRSGNYARAAAELETIGAPASQLAPLYYQAREYDKAIAAAKRSGQQTIVAQSYLQQGKAKEAAEIYQQILAKNPNNLSALQNLAGAQFKMGDKAAYLATTQKLVRLDPTPNRWRTLLVDMTRQPMSREAKLGVYHLMRETNAIKTAQEVEDFAKTAIVSGQSGFAAKVVQEATASGIIPPDNTMAQKIVDAAAKRTADALRTAPADALDPAKAFNAGNAYLGASRYPDATAAYNVAEKGPQADQAALFKGIALIKEGNRSGAKAVFDGIKSGPLADIAALWSLYASTKGV